MKNNDAFGCTTFRKGNYLGRSYDFFCNSIASSVLHTSRIEGVRYESIGMSGSSFNGMTKDKALDGTIDKSIMNTLFSSIVDGINENGVAISTLVVPRGDKGITTGTNPSKPSITARLVSRVVMDKAYSAKNAIKLLSELNIKQTWNQEYELHWMLADANDTYIVETVNNKLSYLGPSAIEGIEDLYNGTLEADVITNFYQTGFKSTFGYTYVVSTNYGLEARAYEVPAPTTADNNYYEYADGTWVEAHDGAYIKQYGVAYGSELYNLLEDDKHYIITTKHEDGTWTFSGVTTVVRFDEPLYHSDDTPVDMPPLSGYTEGIAGGYNTFSMPVTNPTVTPYGAGLERYKIIKDKLAQVNGTNLADDEEAMEIINLVQYTTAYKNDTEWYSEFVSHPQGITNRTELTAIKNTGKLSEEVGKVDNGGDDYRHFYKVYPPTDSSYFGTWDGSGVKYFMIKSESSEESLRVNQGSYWTAYPGNWTAPTQDDWYTEIHGPEDGTDYEDLSDIHYMKGSDMKELVRSVTTSDFVDGVNEFKTLYAEKWAEGGKEATRAFGDEKGDGASWHSNHQCVYDLANKKMLVYPSENGEHAFRVDIHGVVEDEAVEVEGGSDSAPMLILEKIDDCAFTAIKEEYTGDYEGIEHGVFFYLGTDNVVRYRETCRHCEGVDFECEPSISPLNGYTGVCLMVGGFLPNPLVLLKPKQGTVFDFDSDDDEEFDESKWEIVASLPY